METLAGYAMMGIMGILAVAGLIAYIGSVAGARRAPASPIRPAALNAYQWAQWMRGHGYQSGQEEEAKAAYCREKSAYTAQHEAEQLAAAKAGWQTPLCPGETSLSTSDPDTWPKGQPISRTSPARLPEWGRPIKVEPDSVFAKRR
jgi:hypothetical protein